MSAVIGQAVTVAGVSYVITSLAPGSGYWAMRSGSNAFVRLLANPWRLASEHAS